MRTALDKATNARVPDLLVYPGGDLVSKGLVDLRQGRLSEEALLVLVAAPRLRQLGFEIPCVSPSPTIPEHALFKTIEARMERGVHGAYNALIGRIVSFAASCGARSSVDGAGG